MIAILILRIYALYGRNKVVLGILLMLFVTEMVVEIAITNTLSSRFTGRSPDFQMALSDASDPPSAASSACVFWMHTGQHGHLGMGLLDTDDRLRKHPLRPRGLEVHPIHDTPRKKHAPISTGALPRFHSFLWRGAGADLDQPHYVVYRECGSTYLFAHLVY